ncbi:MAG: HEAT repeat domain-containing protein [Deltaproteobacteria bacterium]|nr:HEAT repeat domain-containing protein [Deltaproteobacteria bacterium]
MRGLTGVLIGGGLLLLVVIAYSLRGGDEDSGAAVDRAQPATSAAGAGMKSAGAANRPGSMGADSGGSGSSGGSRSARVEDRLNELRADYEKRQLPGSGAVAANKREVPTAVARQKDMVERAKEDLEDDEADEDPAELEELRQTLFNDPDPDERIGAILMLTGDEGPESMRMLIEAMDDPDAEVRLAVVEALGDRSEEISPATLMKALNDSDPEVRFEAFSTLGDMDTPEAQALLEKAKNDPDEDIRDLYAGIKELGQDDEDDAANAHTGATAAK